jgi:hypothetical protein
MHYQTSVAALFYHTHTTVAPMAQFSRLVAKPAMKVANITCLCGGTPEPWFSGIGELNAPSYNGVMRRIASRCLSLEEAGRAGENRV